VSVHPEALWSAGVSETMASFAGAVLGVGDAEGSGLGVGVAVAVGVALALGVRLAEGLPLGSGSGDGAPEETTMYVTAPAAMRTAITIVMIRPVVAAPR